MEGFSLKKQLISIIIPVFNEEENIDKAYHAIVIELKKHSDLDYEIIFTDNASSDGTFEKLNNLACQDPNVRVLRFVRNFGFQRSILAGYRSAKGDAAIQIDCDLEDPPTVINDFIHLWKNGHDVVIGLRSQRIEPRYMIFLRRLYYKILNRLSDVPHLVDAGDFRLVDKSILQQLQVINDTQPYVRGIISELSRNQIGVQYQRNKREYGSSKFPLRQLIKLASDGLYSFSTTPLRLATYLGTFIAFITAVMIVIYIIFHFFIKQDAPPGFTTTTILILFGISINALLLGIIGEYIGRIHNQLRKRPLVIVDKSINIGYEHLLLSQTE
ncbi:MAG: glycosyltransferase [Gammaproteobacteria bacterium]|nr:MAG: glycosyltransferase [Gammaproteobacteria bacterium]